MDRREVRRGGAETPPPRKKAGNRRGGASERALRRRRALVLFYLFTFLLVLGAAVALCLTVLFQIDGIEVTGNSRYSKEEIIAACGIKKGDNLFLAKTGEAQKAVEQKLPYVGSAKVSRRLPARIIVSVSAAQVSGAMEYQGKYVVVSPQGKALEQRPDKPKDIPVILGVGLKSAQPGHPIEFSDSDTQKLFYDLADCLSRNGLKKITSIDITNRYRILVGYDDRITLNLGLPSDLDYKIRFAKAVIEKELTDKDRGQLDLSDFAEQNKAYFDENASSSPAETSSG